MLCASLFLHRLANVKSSISRVARHQLGAGEILRQHPQPCPQVAPNDEPLGCKPQLGEHLLYDPLRSEEHTSELQSQSNLVCRLLLEKKKKRNKSTPHDQYSTT